MVFAPFVVRIEFVYSVEVVLQPFKEFISLNVKGERVRGASIKGAVVRLLPG